MLRFLAANAATILISAVLLLAVTLIVRNMIRRKRQGKCASCDGCESAEGCHGRKTI